MSEETETEMFARARKEYNEKKKNSSPPAAAAEDESSDDEWLDDEQFYYEKIAEWGEPFTIDHDEMKKKNQTLCQAIKEAIKHRQTDSFKENK